MSNTRIGNDVRNLSQAAHEFAMESIEFEHEKSLATRNLVTAIVYDQRETQNETRDVYHHNRMKLTIVGNTLDGYSREYGELPNKMRHYG